MSTPAQDIGAMMIEQLHAMNQQFAAGMKAGKAISNTAHTALKVAYDLASKDETAKLPTPLSCAIENILRLHVERQTNDYANAGVKRDQLERHEGRPEHDMNTRCEPLESHR